MEQARKFLAVIVLGIVMIGLQACGATTCATMTLKYQDHPSKAAPAKKVVFKCGEKKVEWFVDNPPSASCMSGCFSK